MGVGTETQRRTNGCDYCHLVTAAFGVHSKNQRTDPLTSASETKLDGRFHSNLILYEQMFIYL